jgi:hypothetical protein
MNALPTGLLTLTLMLMSVTFVVAQDAHATTTAPAVAFGMDADSAAAQASAGVKPDYGTMWIGPWTLTSGWGGPDGQMATLKSQGVTPAIHFYYWGDDISPSCVENGCWSSIHNTQKDRAHWQTLGDQLGSHLNSKMGGAKAVVFLESEFNKNGIGTYEPFDGYLADMANRLHAAYPNAVLVLGFGNWGSSDWHTFDRAAAACQMVGLQGMKGSTKDSATSYDSLYSATLSGVKTLNGLFHKPIMLTDIALSSYPDSTYTTMQKDNLAKFFTGMSALTDNNVKAMVYRSWKDSPTMSTANYYGEAERHWGVVKSDGTWKPSATVWVNGVKAIRAGATATATSTAATTTTTAATTAATTSPFAATFTPKSVGNDYWVETAVSSSQSVAKVEVRLGSGLWAPLPKDAWGTYAAGLHAPNGTLVQFRATSATGATATSAAYTWT